MRILIYWYAYFWMIGADDNLSVDVDQVGQLGGLFLSFDYFCLNRSIQTKL